MAPDDLLYFDYATFCPQAKLPVQDIVGRTNRASLYSRGFMLTKLDNVFICQLLLFNDVVRELNGVSIREKQVSHVVLPTTSVYSGVCAL